MVCGVSVLNFLNFIGWLFSVDGRWKLYFISVFLCVWLFWYILLICGIVMWDLLIISRLFVGR